MRWKIFLGAAAIVVVVLSLHTTVLERLSIGGVRPDLLLAIVVYLSLIRGPVVGIAAGFIVGLLQDAQSHHELGINALSKALAGYAASYTWEGLDKESVYTQVIVVFGAGVLHNIVFFLLYSGSQLTAAPGLLLRIGIPSALYTAVVAPLLVAALGWLFGFRMDLGAATIRKR